MTFNQIDYYLGMLNEAIQAIDMLNFIDGVEDIICLTEDMLEIDEKASKTAIESPTNVSMLPDEVLEKILFYLDPVSQLNADLVNKRWNGVLANWHQRIHRQKEADYYLDSSLKAIRWDPSKPEKGRDKFVWYLLEMEKYWLSKPNKTLLTSVNSKTRLRVCDPGCDFVMGISSFVVYKEKLFVAYANNTVSHHTAFSFRKVRDLYSSPTPHLVSGPAHEPENLISLALNRNTLAALIPQYNKISIWSAKTENLLKSFDLQPKVYQNYRIFEGLCVSSTAMFVIDGRSKIMIWSLDSENPQLGISEDFATIVIPVAQQHLGKMLIAANNHRLAFAVPELRESFHTMVTSHRINQLKKWKTARHGLGNDNYCVSGRILSMTLSQADLLAFLSRGSAYALGTILTILKIPDQKLVWKSKMGRRF